MRNQNVLEKDAGYSSYLLDGNECYDYARSELLKSSGSVKITSISKSNSNLANIETIKYGYTFQALGYPFGDEDRVDNLIKNNSKQIKLREKTEKIRDSDCFVIDGVVNGKGKYTVWIDPVHDYHIAKIQVRRNENDSVRQVKLKRGEYSNETYEVVQFQRVGEKWFPQEIKSNVIRFDLGKHYQEDEIIKFTEVKLNPDHELLKSFVPDDIPNGTKVKLSAFPSSLTFSWHDGKVVDKDGKVIMDLTEKKK